MSEKTFADGFNFDRRENAPDFVVGRLSIKANAGKTFIDTYVNDRGYVNINILKSNKGNYYCELDTWQPKKKEDGSWSPKKEEEAVGENSDDNLPF